VWGTNRTQYVDVDDIGYRDRTDAGRPGLSVGVHRTLRVLICERDLDIGWSHGH
jgi:hypothetical protein